MIKKSQDIAVIRKKAHQLESELDKMGRDAKNGDFPSIIYLAALATKSTIDLWDAANAHPDLIRKCAKQNLLWPVIGFRGDNLLNEVRSFFDKIGLGNNIACLSTDIVNSWPTPARKTIYENLKLILRLKVEHSTQFYAVTHLVGGKNRREYFIFTDQLATDYMNKLKMDKHPFRHATFNQQYLADFYKKIFFLDELSKDSMSEWFVCIKMSINIAYRGFPESDNELRKIGKYRELKGGAKAGSKTAEANIRDGIFIRLKTTLRSILKNETRHLVKVKNRAGIRF